MKSARAIPTEKIVQRLQFENPWWKTGQIQKDLMDLPRRLYFQIFIPFVTDVTVKRAVVLMGPRRVGKTVMMHHCIHGLIKNKIPPKKIFFIGIDNPIYMNIGLEELVHFCSTAAGVNVEDTYVFFDEIQYLKDWERHLKILVDSYPKIKFIVSGSAAAALKLKSTESGAGRFTEFMLPPLTFQEYLSLKGKSNLVSPGDSPFGIQTNDIKDLNQEFLDYINYGGYPEVIFSPLIQNNMSRYIKGDIIDKVLLRDLPSLYGIKDVQELNRFFAYLAYNTGKEFSIERISQESGVEKNLIKKYTEYLQAAFLISVVNKVDEKSAKFKRITYFKIYLTNPSIRSALFSPIDFLDDEMGAMVETAIFAQWMHQENASLRYARWKVGQTEGEVDLVSIDTLNQKAIWCTEIKWSNRYVQRPVELKSLILFCEKNKLNHAIVTSIDKMAQLEYKGLSIQFVPAALYAYWVGAQTLMEKADMDISGFVTPNDSI